MLQRVWFGLLVAALLLSAGLAVHRHRIESGNNRVELVADVDAWLEAARDWGISPQVVYDELSARGVAGFALSQWEFSQALEARKVRILPGYLLLSLQEVDFPVHHDQVYLQTGPDLHAQEILARLAPLAVEVAPHWWSLPANPPRPVDPRRQQALPTGVEAYLPMPISILPEAVDLLEGRRALPRIFNSRPADPQVITHLLGQVGTDLQIFAGGEVLGYPDQVGLVAQIMRDAQMRLGLVEFAGQRGVGELARLLEFQAIRVHSITLGEMAWYPYEMALSRYLRAVRERHHRILYLRPFTSPEQTQAWSEQRGLPPGEDLAWRAQLDWLEVLAGRLGSEGYVVGPAEPFPLLAQPLWVLWILALGAIVGLLFFWDLLLPTPRWLSSLVGLGIWGMLVLATLKGYPLLVRQGLALVVAVAAPTLGPLLMLRRRASLVWAFIPSVAGALLIVGLLGESRFLLGIEGFRGVKVMALLPPLIVLGWGLLEQRGIRPSLMPEDRGAFTAALRRELSHPLTWGQVLLIPALGVLGLTFLLVYVGRTGHDWGIPILQVERFVRDFLEEVLKMRPRNKEIFIGHPALILTTLASPRALPWLLALVAVGQASLVNTFTHIHSPLAVSLLRSIYGMGIGGILGLVALGLLAVLRPSWVRRQGHGF